MNHIKTLALATIWPTTKRLWITALLALVFVVLINIPIVSIPTIFVAWPLITAIPSFQQTSGDVEYWFLGLVLKSPKAFAFFYLYFAVIAYLLLARMGYKALKSDRQRP